MNSRNVDEYKLIRTEMINLKDCITKYIGYVFAGSGAMIYGLAKVDRSGITGGTSVATSVSSSSATEVAFISASFSMLVSLILLTLFYKFNSHNRFAGFCKLLNHERHHPLESRREPVGPLDVSTDEIKQDSQVKDKNPPLFSWEITVGDLRLLEGKPEVFSEVMKSLKISEPTTKELRTRVGDRINKDGKHPSIDTDMNFQGLRAIVRTILLRSAQTDSWGFPPLVVCTFLFIVSGFMSASVFVAYRSGEYRNLWLLGYLIVIGFMQLCLWWHMCGRLYSLMSGSATVYSYYWKLIPMRTLFLNKHRIKPSYLSTEDYLFPETSEKSTEEPA